MKKLLTAAVCAAALVGCGGPIDENDTTGQDQQMLVAPDGLPGGQSTLDTAQLPFNQQAAAQARQAQFSDQYVWGVTGRPHGDGHCGH